MGGKAFEGVTQRIHKEAIPDTLEWLTKNWSGSLIQGGDYMDHLLGSAGKNEYSGDLDLNMRIELYDQENVAKELIKILGEEFVKPRPGNNQIFTAVPIRGDASIYGRVQVDFMFGDYEWQKFSYFSPTRDDSDQSGPSIYIRRVRKYDVSKLKGLYRTELIKALVAFNSDWVLEEDGEMIARVGPTFFHDKGCVWRYRHRPMRKDGTARIKELKELTKEEFMEIYPSAVPAVTDVLKDPEKVVEMILGEGSSTHYAQSFEILWQMVRGRYNAQEIKLIEKIYLERLNNLKAEIPKEVFAWYGIRVT